MFKKLGLVVYLSAPSQIIIPLFELEYQLL